MQKKGLAYFLVLLCTLWFVYIPGVFAESPKKILVLYKQRDPDHQGILKIFNQFLQQAGYTFENHNIEDLLSNPIDMEAYTGIMTTYQSSQMVGGDLYPKWLVQQMEAGRRILIIGNYGAYQGLLKKPDGSFIEWNESTQTINTFFYPFGLQFYFAFTGNNEKLRLVSADQQYAQFQAPISQQYLNYFQLYKSINPNNRVFFEVERSDMPDSKSAFNVITPFGGMILEGYSYYWDSQKNKNLFRVDFPSFIKQVFTGKSPEVAKFNIKTHQELVNAYPLPERQPPISEHTLRPSQVNRQVLLLYKKSEVSSLEKSLVYNRVSVILEYLGLIPVIKAIEDGLPDDQEMDHYFGIITWHTTPHMYQAQAYGDWMIQQIEQGKRVVILEHYGASFDRATQEKTSNQQAVFAALGIQYAERPVRREELLPPPRIVDNTMLGYEHEFNPKIITYQHTYHSDDPRNKVFLAFDDRDYGSVDFGIVTANGGVSLQQSPFYFPPHDKDRVELIHRALKGEVAPEIAEQPTIGAWNLNPYHFFSESLGLKKFPAADTTTLNGSRIFYAHIDGDALDSVSLIDKAHLAGWFIYQDILKKYSDIPTTVSVITKLIENEGNPYHRPSVVLARKIYKLANVDIAVHTATHPFDWVEGDPYVTNPDTYPYKIGYRSHDLLEEIWGSKLFADHNLAPNDKKTTSLFWSGATNPDKRALEIVWRAGMHNLNGGDPRFDDENPSIANLVPYSLAYPPYRQYLTSAQNDYYYTLFLTGDWSGQKKLIQHFEKTDKPQRIYPMNLYFHFYSGIKKDSLEALQVIYDYIRTLDSAAIFATQYLEIAEDFYRTKIGYDGSSYWIENNGFLRTIRFEGHQHVDMRRSEGILGYSHNDNGQTYIHLDGRTRRKLYLSDTEPTTPFLIQASQFIDQFSSTAQGVEFIYRGFGKTLLKIGGLQSSSDYQLTLGAKHKRTITATIKTDQLGILIYRTELEAPQTSYVGNLTLVRPETT